MVDIAKFVDKTLQKYEDLERRTNDLSYNKKTVKAIYTIKKTGRRLRQVFTVFFEASACFGHLFDRRSPYPSFFSPERCRALRSDALRREG